MNKNKKKKYSSLIIYTATHQTAAYQASEGDAVDEKVSAVFSSLGGVPTGLGFTRLSAGKYEVVDNTQPSPVKKTLFLRVSDDVSVRVCIFVCFVVV